MQDTAGGERGRKSAAGRNPVKGFPSRVWKGSQVSHLWLNRRSWALIVSIPSPGHYRGLASNSRHASAYKGALRITGGPPAEGSRWVA